MHTDKPGDPGHRRTLECSCSPQLHPRPWKTPTHQRAQGPALASAAHRALRGGTEGGSTEFLMALVLVYHLPMLVQFPGSCSGPPALLASPLAPSIPAYPILDPSHSLHHKCPLHLCRVGLGPGPSSLKPPLNLPYNALAHTPLPGWLLIPGYAPLAPYPSFKEVPQVWREGQGEPLRAPG